ncbi:MAG: type II toxin-antitoxin system RelB/DinJ family antitoxin [Moraxellaceae bacterium]|nr:type II toxin-antitoxin system RelB/DinJ family antitoxin [Moraxellaceae bacterium]
MATITANIDDNIQSEASAVLANMGLTISDVIQSTLAKIAREKSYVYADIKLKLDEEQIRQNKQAMAGCLAQYARPELFKQENQLMNEKLSHELMEKYFVN